MPAVQRRIFLSAIDDGRPRGADALTDADRPWLAVDHLDIDRIGLDDNSGVMLRLGIGARLVEFSIAGEWPRIGDRTDPMARRIEEHDATVVENASRGDRRAYRGILSELAEIAARPEIVGPVLLIIGDVVAEGAIEAAPAALAELVA